MAERSGGQRPSVADLLARSEGSAPPARTRRLSRQNRLSRPVRRRGRRRVVGGALVLLLLVGIYYVGLLGYVDNSVERVDVLRPSGPEIISAGRQLGAENFLLVGSADGDSVGSADGDSVGSADGDSVGSADGERDTTILVHLSQDGSQAVVVVLPGDAYVDVPACQGPDGQPTEPYGGAFSSVYETGGAACVVRTVQLLTGLRINHYVQLDLAGFPDMVEALGGVPMCLSSPLWDPRSGLDLPAGVAVVDGGQTLPFLRLQTQQGAAETERIQRQQQFLASMLDRSLSPRTVVDPVRLTRFLTAAADSLTLDPDTTLGDLKRLVELLRDLNSEAVLLLTAPIADPSYRPVGSASSYVLLDEQLGRQLYQSIIEDTALPRGSASAAGEAASPPAGDAGCG